MDETSYRGAFPLKALQGKAGRQTPWLLLDPGLRTDLVAAYRAVRLLFLAFIALLGHPLRSQADCEVRTPETEIWLTESMTESGSLITSGRFEQRVEERSEYSFRSPGTVRSQAQNTRSPQLLCLRTYRAHAPPRGQISDEIPLNLSLPVAESYPLPFAFIIGSLSPHPHSSSGIFLRMLHPLRTSSVRAPTPSTQFHQLQLAKGENCHVCC